MPSLSQTSQIRHHRVDPQIHAVHVPLTPNLPSPHPFTVASSNSGPLYLLHFLAINESWCPPSHPRIYFLGSPSSWWKKFYLPHPKLLQNGKMSMYLPCSSKQGSCLSCLFLLSKSQAHLTSLSSYSVTLPLYTQRHHSTKFLVLPPHSWMTNEHHAE